MKQMYFNNQFVNEEDVHISPMTHAFNYGTGCFEGIRAYYNETDNSLNIFRMKEHFERMERSAKVLFLKLPHTADRLCEITEQLVEKNFVQEDVYIRPLAYKSGQAVGNFNLQSLENGFLIYTVPMGRYLPAEKGIRACISSWIRVPDNAIPPRAKVTGSYINTSLAKTESLMSGYDEALFLDREGHVVEGSAENLFVVKNNVIYTPPVADDILQGITRDTVMMLCKEELHLEVTERSIDRSEIYQVNEVFLVGTGAEVSPVREIDGRVIGNGAVGPIASQVKKLYFDIVHGNVTKYNSWVTKITKKT